MTASNRFVKLFVILIGLAMASSVCLADTISFSATSTGVFSAETAGRIGYLSYPVFMETDAEGLSTLTTLSLGTLSVARPDRGVDQYGGDQTFTLVVEILAFDGRHDTATFSGELSGKIKQNPKSDEEPVSIHFASGSHPLALFQDNVPNLNIVVDDVTGLLPGKNAEVTGRIFRLDREVIPTPEPSSLVLFMGAVVAGMVGVVRQRRAKTREIDSGDL